MSESGVFLALCSTIIFAFSSVIFQSFAQKFGALWMNAFKASVALFAFSVVFFFSFDGQFPYWKSFVFFFISGFVGLNLGDLLLLNAFKRIGSARTLMIFSFQPLMMAAFGYLMFRQALEPQKVLAILFLIACVFVISYERYRSDRRWEWLGPLFAFGGVLLDCAGVLMTRYAFELDDSVSVVEANFYRCLGAGVGFVLMARFFKMSLKKRFTKLKTQTKLLVLLASFSGTFLSLWIYLTALETGHLAKIAAVVGAGPLFTALIESIYFRRWPSRYLWVSLFFFFIGFVILADLI